MWSARDVGAREREEPGDGGLEVLAGVRELREHGAGAWVVGPGGAEAVRGELREGADAVCGEAAGEREGDDPAPQVVAGPAAVVVRADAAVGLLDRADRDLRVPAVREAVAVADDRELHVHLRAVRPAPRDVVELLRPEGRVVAVDDAAPAPDGPGEPVQQHRGPAGLRLARADAVRVDDALLLVKACLGSELSARVRAQGRGRLRTSE